MLNRALTITIAAGIICARATAQTQTAYQVTFDVTTELQNVFVYADEFNGKVYAWDLFPMHIGTVPAGRSTFQLGNHNLQSWAILATALPARAVAGINDSIDPPDGLPFETVFPGFAESTVVSNIATLYTGGAYNTQQAFFLTEWVLAQEDTLKTDRPTGTLHVYAFSNAVNVGTATFSISTSCPADFNGDGFITGEDFDLFVQAFEAGDMRSDFNGDGFLTGEDFDQFVRAFEAGC
jgi:hypothetical protein